MKEHYIAANDGVKTFVLELEPFGAITAAPIFCIHGLTRNHKDFAGVFDFLRGFGRKVYAIDVRGRGKSDRDPNPANYNPITYVGDVMNIMQKLEIEKAVFIGTSMGGLISMIMATFAAAKMEGIILNDVGPELDEVGVARIRSYVGKSKPAQTWEGAAQNIKTIALYAFPKFADDDAFWLDFAHKSCVQTDAGVVFDYDQKISESIKPDQNAQPANLWPQFPMLKNIPTLVIRGGISDILSPAIIAKMLEIKPDLQVQEVPDVGHAPLLNEAESLAAIGKFLQGLA